MSYIIEKNVPTPEEIKEMIPNPFHEMIKADREDIINIIEGTDNRKILIVGPCSAWPNPAVIEYAKQLKKISDKVKDKIKIVMRVYTQKPRTTLGWTGPVNQPDPFAPADIEKGIMYCREMMLGVLKVGLPIADEALFTHNEGYFDDIISWIAIGARSSEDQEHRIYASMINHPVGIKNPTSGSIKKGIDSVIAAQHSHVFLLSGKQIRTMGNDRAHLVLRGGDGKSNLFLEDIKKTIKLLKEKNVKNPTIIADLSHENSIDPASGKKDAKYQKDALRMLLHHMKEDKEIMEHIKGFMIESFLKTGKQDLNNANSIDELDMEGLSVTDECISIIETEKIINELYNSL